MNDIHCIFGAGQVGMHLARHLASEGIHVRLVRRSAPGDAIPNVTWMQGDALDAAFADRVCEGATVVYNCTNPPDYHRWDGVLQPLYRAIWDAAARAGARLVQLDNLYMMGRPASPFDERAPQEPCSDKGRLRKQLADELLERHRRGELKACIGRASDYFGPDTPNAAVFRPDTYVRILAGKTVFVLGDPDMPHSYSYTPDVARGLARLGRDERALGRAWHLPVAAQLTTRELVDRFAAAAGTSVTVRRVPNWAMTTIGLFSPLVRAIGEMAYQWEIPYLMDDAAFRLHFQAGPTPLDEAIATTLASERQSLAA